MGVLVGLLVGCGPPPTPFAVTPIATEPPTLPAISSGQSGGVDVLPTRVPVRYGVLPNTADYIPAAALQAANAQVDVLHEQSELTQYDVLVGYGVYDGWTESPVRTTVALALNTALAPLDDADINVIVREAARPADAMPALEIPGATALYTPAEDARTLRERLANAGYPDGITIYASAAAVPGTAQTLASLATANVQVVPVQNAPAPPHLTLAVWHSDDERAALVDQFGAGNVIDLYALPISYSTNGDLLTTFTDDGWVIAARREGS